jgi:hypothetical protein
MELWEKAIRLERFIAEYTPRNYREPIRSFTHIPTVLPENYTYFENSFNQGTIDLDLITYSDVSLGNKPVYRFNVWYLIQAIKEYFEKDKYHKSSSV